MFSLEAHSAVRKDLRKLTAQAADFIVHESLPAIANNPEIGEALHGIFRKYKKFVVHVDGVAYRIVYEIDENEKIIFVLGVGSCEGFYDRLKRRLT